MTVFARQSSLVVPATPDAEHLASKLAAAVCPPSVAEVAAGFLSSILASAPPLSLGMFEDPCHSGLSLLQGLVCCPHFLPHLIRTLLGLGQISVDSSGEQKSIALRGVFWGRESGRSPQRVPPAAILPRSKVSQSVSGRKALKIVLCQTYLP